MKTPILDVNNKNVGEVELSDDIFATPIRKGLIYDTVKMQMASRRKGNSSTKNRSEVKGTTAKMYRQKGTGRARHGDYKVNLFVGGGTAFGPKPRDYSYKLPKKARKIALRSALSTKQKDGKILILDDFPVKEIKTKEAVSILSKLGIASGLIVVDAKNEILEKSVRNIVGIKLVRTEGINVYDLFKYEHTIIMKDALGKVEEVLKP